jgi:hypothetical protein
MQKHNTYGAVRVVATRPGQRGPCRRCGIEIQYRNDRPGKMCRDCVSVVGQ